MEKKELIARIKNDQRFKLIDFVDTHEDRQSSFQALISLIQDDSELKTMKDDLVYRNNIITLLDYFVFLLLTQDAPKSLTKNPYQELKNYSGQIDYLIEAARYEENS